jgi:hypothetical protein
MIQDLKNFDRRKFTLLDLQTILEAQEIPIPSQAANERTSEILNKTYGSWGFYDWFCNQRSLPAKSRLLSQKLLHILKLNQTGHHFDPSTTYVWFKNNCPAGWGPLYDDLRLADISTGHTIFTIVPREGHYPVKVGDPWGYHGRQGEKVTYHSELWGQENSFDGALVSGDWESVLQFFETPR